MAVDNILDTIGHTPLARINRPNSRPEEVEIFAKVEGFNPSGSIKDRIALNMIEHAEQNKRFWGGASLCLGITRNPQTRHP